MIIRVGNIKCKAEFGGKDYLLRLPKELRSYLSVEVKGAYFAQKHSGYKWDGHRYFINDKGEFATGFLPMVYRFVRDLGADVQLIDERLNVPTFVPDMDYSLPMFDDIADHQKRMVDSVDRKVGDLYFPRGIWDTATNSRKTATFAMLVRNVQKPRVLFLVHSEELFKQHYEFFSQMFHVERITSKHYGIGDFTMAMVRSLHNRARKSMTVARDLKNSFNIVCVDECHRAGASEYSWLLQKVDAGMRIFMSGSPLDGDDPVANMIIVGLSGDVICKVSKRELMDAGISLEPTVNFYKSPAKGIYFDYDEEYDKLIKYNRPRAEMLGRLIAERKGKKILVNFIEREHGAFMYEVFRSMPELSNFFIDYVHGVDPERDAKVAAFKAGHLDVLLSSSIMQEGININDINVLVYAQGGKAKIALNQWSGRTERHDGVSSGVEIVDVWDTGKYLSNHSNKRKIFWLKEQFKINYHYEQRNGRPR